jgi:DNA-binding transcriptional ArsR family regulator
MRKAETQVNLMFRAFSDRTRLRILRLLLDGELCVGDIISVIRVPQLYSHMQMQLESMKRLEPV